MDMKM